MNTDDELDTILLKVAQTYIDLTSGGKHKYELAPELPRYETLVEAKSAILALLAAQRQRWEAETTQILDRLTIKATETKDVKTGAIRQTVGLGYILNERRIAALDGERGKEQ